MYTREKKALTLFDALIKGMIVNIGGRKYKLDDCIYAECRLIEEDGLGTALWAPVFDDKEIQGLMGLADEMTNRETDVVLDKLTIELNNGGTLDSNNNTRIPSSARTWS